MALATLGQPQERCLRLLKAHGSELIVAGERALYQVNGGSGKVIQDDLPLADIAAVFSDSALPVLIDAQGRGIRVDGALNRRGSFHTVPGAVPTSADDGGRHVVLRHPDGTHTLLDQKDSKLGRIVYQHDGPLAVNPGGDLFALGGPEGIRLLDGPSLKLLLGGGHG
jgi:hypothetical protein